MHERRSFPRCLKKWLLVHPCCTPNSSSTYVGDRTALPSTSLAKQHSPLVLGGTRGDRWAQLRAVAGWGEESFTDGMLHKDGITVHKSASPPPLQIAHSSVSFLQAGRQHRQ